MRRADSGSVPKAPERCHATISSSTTMHSWGSQPLRPRLRTPSRRACRGRSQAFSLAPSSASRPSGPCEASSISPTRTPASFSIWISAIRHLCRIARAGSGQSLRSPDPRPLHTTARRCVSVCSVSVTASGEYRREESWEARSTSLARMKLRSTCTCLLSMLAWRAMRLVSSDAALWKRWRSSLSSSRACLSSGDPTAHFCPRAVTRLSAAARSLGEACSEARLMSASTLPPMGPRSRPAMRAWKVARALVPS
mmetsp:Transcript_44977/g.143221  ORF Transcript_44977/g.143221 Transcript_44977/m.143221 type:complete len:253 (+) Transcript_44977:1389-2147(+)